MQEEGCKMPLISVVLLSYNYQDFLPEAIESVLRQTFDDFELIIIDDGSKDRSQQIIENYAARDSRIRPVFNEINRGISITSNTGVQLARGRYCAGIASDDRWRPEKLEIQMKVLEQFPDAIVWTEGEIINDQGEPTGESYTGMHQGEEKQKSGFIFNELLKNHFIFGSSRIAKTVSLQRFKRNERLLYLNDYLQNIELALEYPFSFIPQPLAEYRVHRSNTIKRDNKGYCRDSLYLCWYLLTKYGHRMNHQDVKNVLMYPVKSFYHLVKNLN